MFSYCDGGISKNHMVYIADYSALQLHFQSNDFEVCNPMKHHRSIHKLCTFYFFLGNLEDQHHSKLKNIYLALLVKSKYNKSQNAQSSIAPINRRPFCFI